MPIRQEALEYHRQGRKGKIEVNSTKPCLTQHDLSLAYSPGVAEPCRAIHADPSSAYEYTAKGNLVAVVSNGSAVLGLGNIGGLASKPVMEGKGVLFKRFADVDVFDIELNTQDPDEIIRCCQLLEPTFGGINLEDIKAPECFYIEETLKKTMKIPVFHDDQHGTAIISAAALLNALELVNKDIDKVRVVCAGAGAAGIASAKLYCTLGAKKENIIMVDSKGVLYEGRGDKFNPYKVEFVRNTDARTLADALIDADVFVGVSVANTVSQDMVRSMARDPIIFALANPDPEISYPEAITAREDIIMATGRSDFPNQVNNVLGFPFLFRGALDVHATAINDEMKIAAVHALAALAKENVPEEVARVYGAESFQFGRDYIIPKPFDRRVLTWETAAVAQAAMDSGVAQREVDIEKYKWQLRKRIGQGSVIMSVVVDKAMKDPKKIVFPEGDVGRILQAATILVEEGIAKPILLGNPSSIRRQAQALKLDLLGIELIDSRKSEKRAVYAERYFDKRSRKGITKQQALRQMNDRTHFGLMMLEMGDCDAVLSGAVHDYPEVVRSALKIIDISPSCSRVSGLCAMIFKDKLYLFADTTLNINPTASELAEIAMRTANVAKAFDIEPRVAMLSFSNFGSVQTKESRKVAEATAIVKQMAPDLVVEGEMQADTALMPELVERYFPFSELKEKANVFIFPELNSGNIAYKLLQRLGGFTAIGPILMGFSKTVHALHPTLDVHQIVDMATIAVVDAQALEKWGNN